MFHYVLWTQNSQLKFIVTSTDYSKVYRDNEHRKKGEVTIGIHKNFEL